MTKIVCIRVFTHGVAFALIMALAALAQAQGQQPPESAQIDAAIEIQDMAARLKELERIKAVFPKSRYMVMLNMYIAEAKVTLTPTLDAILELQKESLKQLEGYFQFTNYGQAAEQILDHKNFKEFDKAKVTESILSYKAQIDKFLQSQSFINSFPEPMRPQLRQGGNEFGLYLARAYLNEGKVDQAVLVLEDYKRGGGNTGADYQYVVAEAAIRRGRDKEAYEGYLAAAAENYKDATDRAKALYLKINRNTDGFEASLEAKLRALPYHPEPLKAPADWKSKAVLAELFTGSECPPCVGADLGFDGLLEAYDARYLAVLEYHLPIPGPDPMMNPATKKRQDYYGVRGTPSTFFDGESKFGGGSARAASEKKFKEYSGEINARLAEAPKIVLTVAAERSGDLVKVDYGFDKALPNADYNLVLVQKEVMYKGGNGILYHKMVARDFLTVDSAAPEKQRTMNLAELEKAAARYLDDFEKAHRFAFKEKRFAIEGAKLAVIFFVQDKVTKKVYNSVVADVK